MGPPEPSQRFGGFFVTYSTLEGITNMLRILIFAAVLLTCSFAAAKPVRQSPKPPPAKVEAVPDLAYESQWGVITQTGKILSIDGHPQWCATGHIREDGKVWILWTDLASGIPCPGVYEVKAGELHGVWGRAENVTVEKDGSLSGFTMGDTIRRLKTPDPVFK